MKAAPTKPEITERAPVTIQPKEDKVLIAPSMMCVDPLNFESALRQVEELGVDMLHMDIMDGHFVPNAAMGLGVVEALAEKTALPIDVHLMVEDNDFFVGLLQNLPIYQISVHYESCKHLDRTLSRIRETGAKAGLAINPATPLDVLDYALERLDYVLIMSVNPGFAGQKPRRPQSENRRLSQVFGCAWSQICQFKLMEMSASRTSQRWSLQARAI